MLKTRLDQFMVDAVSVGRGVGGKNAITKTTARKANASRLTGKPSTPRLNLEGNIGCPESLLQTKHPMHTLYDIISVPLVKETRLLKATVLPMLINDSRHEIIVDVTTAFRGTPRRGLTYLE